MKIGKLAHRGLVFVFLISAASAFIVLKKPRTAEDQYYWSRLPLKEWGFGVKLWPSGKEWLSASGDFVVGHYEVRRQKWGFWLLEEIRHYPDPNIAQ